MKNFKITIITGIIFLSACTNNTSPGKVEETAHHDANESESITSLTEAQMKSIDVQLGGIEKKQLTSSLKANGLLKVPHHNKANATAALGGVIKTILVQIGNTVKKGQAIASISNNTFIILQEDYLNVTAKLEYARLELTRQTDLQKGNAGTLKNLQLSKAEFDGLKSKQSSLEKQLQMIGIQASKLNSENIQSSVQIVSPISGTISDLYVNIGTYVDANNPIAEIVDNSQLHLDLYVYEKDLSKIKVGQTIHFTLTNNPGKEYDADVYAISNTFEQNTKAIAVHALVKGDKQGLINGMSITALVSLENALLDAVPEDAIVNHNGQDYIFIVKSTDSGAGHERHAHHHEGEGHESVKNTEAARGNSTVFERIPIRKGTSDVGYSEITLLKEIPLGSKVVVKGAFFILATLSNKGEAHSH